MSVINPIIRPVRTFSSPPHCKNIQNMPSMKKNAPARYQISWCFHLELLSLWC